jgi:hypothetical protein
MKVPAPRRPDISLEIDPPAMGAAGGDPRKALGHQRKRLENTHLLDTARHFFAMGLAAFAARAPGVPPWRIAQKDINEPHPS